MDDARPALAPPAATHDARPALAPPPSSTSRELVLGLPRSAVPGGLDWRGVRETGVDEVLRAFEARGEYRRRVDVEDDPSFQQLIPYVVVQDGGRVFLMRRLRTGGDTRLHERFSIGLVATSVPMTVAWWGASRGSGRRRWPWTDSPTSSSSGS